MCYTTGTVDIPTQVRKGSGETMMCDLMQCHDVYSAGGQRSQCQECPKMFQFNLLKNKESECNSALFMTTSSGYSYRSHTALEAALMGTSLLLILMFTVFRSHPPPTPGE